MPVDRLNVLRKDRRALVACLERLKLVVVQEPEEPLDRADEVAFNLACAIDLLTVLPLGTPELNKALFTHLDVILAEAVLDHVGYKGGQGPCVVCPSQTVIERVFVGEARANRVLAVLAHIGDHV